MTSNYKTHTIITLALSLFLFSTSASAAIVSLVDNFDSEGTSLNYNSFANFDVLNGSVDTISNGQYGIQCFGGAGVCVDLDGSSNNAGELISKDFFSPGEYTLQFAISGNQRSGTDSLNVSLGDYFETFVLASNAPFTAINRLVNITGTNSQLIFSNAGSDNLGIILDNVSVDISTVPVPAAFWLFGSALLGFIGRLSIHLAHRV